MEHGLQSLVTSFWAAIDGRALSGLDRAEASLAFLSALFECTIFLARRILNDRTTSILLNGTKEETARRLVAQQVSSVWEEISTTRLKLDIEKAAEQLAKFFLALLKSDEGEC